MIGCPAGLEGSDVKVRLAKTRAMIFEKLVSFFHWLEQVLRGQAHIKLKESVRLN